jgi:HK97 family phage prohead protease
MQAAGRPWLQRSAGEWRICGYGAVFYNAADPGTTFALASDIVECISPTAFTRALQNQQDVRGLFNHDPNLLLGRTKSETMSLSVDKRGLRYEITPGNTTWSRDVCEMISRGDVSGSSFSFTVQKQTLLETKGGLLLRIVDDVDVFDVGPVTTPAYKSTTAGLENGGRSLGLGPSRQQILARGRQVHFEMQRIAAKQYPSSAAAVKARGRLVEVEMQMHGLN